MLTSTMALSLTMSAVVGVLTVPAPVAAPRPDDVQITSSFSSLLGFMPSKGAASGLVVHNGDAMVATNNDAVQAFEVRGRAGRNVVEASLVADAVGPGVWRFDFNGVPRFREGSLHVLAGEVAVLNARTLIVRTHGERGLVARFAYDLVP